MIMPGIELSVIPRIDISTRVTVVTDGKAGVASTMTRTTGIGRELRAGCSRVLGSSVPSRATRNNRLLVTRTDVYLFTPSSG